MSIGGIQVSAATLAALQNLPQASPDLDRLVEQQEELGTLMERFNRGENKDCPQKGDPEREGQWNEAGQQLFSATFDFNEAVDKMVRQREALGGLISPQDIKDMNIETLMMFVQMGRANMMEAQLRDQIGTIQGRTDKVGELRHLLNALKELKKGEDGKYVISPELAQKLKDNGINVNENKTGDITTYSLDSDGMAAAQARLSADIDQNNASQQMEMIKMQQLMEKRNESYNLLTNFMKKTADQIGSIIGNMR